MANTPIIKKRSGAFSVAVFEETKQGKSGESFTSHSVVLQKSYRDQNNEWQRQTINMFDNNVADVALLLQAIAMELMNTKASSDAPTPKKETVTPEPVDEDLPF